jgi:hypothetical protein
LIKELIKKKKKKKVAQYNECNSSFYYSKYLHLLFICLFICSLNWMLQSWQIIAYITQFKTGKNKKEGFTPFTNQNHLFYTIWKVYKKRAYVYLYINRKKKTKKEEKPCYFTFLYLYLFLFFTSVG